MPRSALWVMRLLIGGLPALAALAAFCTLGDYRLHGPQLRYEQMKLAARQATPGWDAVIERE